MLNKMSILDNDDQTKNDGYDGSESGCDFNGIYSQYLMEQIAKEIAQKQYPQSIQVIHQNLPVHDGFPLIHQYL